MVALFPYRCRTCIQVFGDFTYHCIISASVSRICIPAILLHSVGPQTGPALRFGLPAARYAKLLLSIYKKGKFFFGYIYNKGEWVAHLWSFWGVAGGDGIRRLPSGRPDLKLFLNCLAVDRLFAISDR